MDLLDLPATVRPDIGKIYELIHAWDHRCPDPAACRRRVIGVEKFARHLRRGPSTFYNLNATPGKRISAGLAEQIARALHVVDKAGNVDISQITLPETAETPEAPQPVAAVRKAA